MHQKLISESFDFDFEDIASLLKRFTSKIKEFHRNSGKPKRQLYADMLRLQEHLQEIFSRPRNNVADRGRLDTLESHFRAILAKFTKIRPEPEAEEGFLRLSKAKNEEEFEGIVECEHLAVQDENELRHKKLSERKEVLEQLGKEMRIVNDMFKDTATMVGEQGEVLEQTQENVEVAERETGRAVEELERADGLQRRAKRICFVVFGVVAVIVTGIAVVFFTVAY
jgi:t-SNARE complex subunit (syntaxin)